MGPYWYGPVRIRSNVNGPLINVEACIEIEVNSLFRYVERSNESFLKAVKDEDLLSPGMPKEIIKVKRMEA